MIERRRPWGSSPQGPPDVTVSGSDADLAAAVRRHPHGHVEFTPGTSRLARALGLTEPADAYEVPMDALALASETLGVPEEPEDRFWDGDTGDVLAVNAVVVGVPPDELTRLTRRVPLAVTVDGKAWFDGPATTVVVANGQFVGDADVAPRGHPGDGVVEVQVYALAPGQRRAMRTRLATGSHVPHPDIHQTKATRVGIACEGGLRLDVDGESVGTTTGLELEVLPGWYHLRI